MEKDQDQEEAAIVVDVAVNQALTDAAQAVVEAVLRFLVAILAVLRLMKMEVKRKIVTITPDSILPKHSQSQELIQEMATH